MQFPGYLVSIEEACVRIDRVLFDETELAPETDWKEALLNFDLDTQVWGYTESDSAIRTAIKLISGMNNIALSEEDVGSILAQSLSEENNSEFILKLTKLVTGYKLLTIDDAKTLNAALNC